MKTLYIRYTVPVAVEVPDVFPVGAEELVRVAEWKANDWSDGRYPYATEKAVEAAQDLCRHHVNDAVFHHYCEAVRKHFPEDRDDLEGRNALIARCMARVEFGRAREVEVSVTEHPVRSEQQRGCRHVVLCRADRQDDGTAGPYELATRTVFEGRGAAEQDAASLAPEREPIVVEMPLSELRIGDERGRLDYWKR